MSVKKEPLTEKGVLDSEMKQLMTPEALKELKDLSPTIQQFLLRWQDHRDMILTEQLKEELKVFLEEVYIKNRSAISKEVTDNICKQMAETLIPVWNSLNGIDKGISDIKSDITTIKLDLIDIKGRMTIVEGKVSKDSEKIEVLEKRTELLARTQKWWNIALRIAIAVLVSTLITYIVITRHTRKLHEISVPPIEVTK